MFLVAAAALSIYVPIRQRILRGRVEQLLADICAIQLGNNTWTEA